VHRESPGPGEEAKPSLNEEIERLHALLREHGIEPDSGAG
jgi:hypothetical protein